MNIPPEPASFSDDDADTACESLRCQVAAARAAVAKHHARLIDQLDELSTDATDAPEEPRRTP